MDKLIKRRIHVGEFKITDKIRENINKVLDSERISESTQVYSFEREWAKFIGTKFSVSLNSGTSALIAGLEALKIKYNLKAKSKIITTPLTYIATTNSIVITGFEPIFVDIEEDNFGISPHAIEELLESVDNPEEYSLIIPVHLFGYPVDMDEINRIAKKYCLLVIEDSAQAHGSKYKGKVVGSLSELSTFSFFIAHNIQAGQLGAVNTNDKDICTLIRQIKSNGRICACNVCTRSQGKCPNSDLDTDPRFTHVVFGYNLRPTEIEATIGLAQLEHVDNILKRRQKNVKKLNDYLQEFSDTLKTPNYSDDVSYLAYPLILKDSNISIKTFKSKLEKEGIETRPFFSFIPHQKAYSQFRLKYEGKLPVAEFLSNHGFYIGCHQYLTDEDLEYIYNKFKLVVNSMVK